MTPEQKREYMREWRTNNRNKIRQYDRKYYAEDRETYRARHKEYQLKNLDSFAERSAKWDEKNHEGCLLRAARQRAKKKGIPFNIDLSDISIPGICPILGIPILRAKGKKTGQSATLDRIVNDLGYVKGNVWVISSKANLMKNNATEEELIQFSKWVAKHFHLDI